MLFFIIYLLDKPLSQCSKWEARLKTKITAVDISFFDDLKVDRKTNRLGSIIDGTSRRAPD